MIHSYSTLSPKRIVASSNYEKTCWKNKHPWVFLNSITNHPIKDHIPAGDVVDLVNSKGNFLARGMYEPFSKIVVRILTWKEEEKINEAFWYNKINEAYQRRITGFSHGISLPSSSNEINNAYRLVNSEADFLPGLVVDHYNKWLVVQSHTAGIDKHLPLIQEALFKIIKPSGIYERSDHHHRSSQNLKSRNGILRFGSNSTTGINEMMPPEEGIEVVEDGRRMIVDIVNGHKTGLYLDQRENRTKIGRLCRGKRVLNCFSYTGGFSVAAALGQASSIIQIDSSQSSLNLAEHNLKLNQVQCPVQSIEGNAFSILRDLVANSNNSQDHRQNYHNNHNQNHDLGEACGVGKSFNVIILDPPKFAHCSQDIRKASRGYKDINMLAMKLLVNHGYLATFSCSGAITSQLFQQIVFGAAVDTGTNFQIISKLESASDHVTHLNFPEGSYLKGLLLRKIY